MDKLISGMILNLGGGKILPLDIDLERDRLIINVDQGYYPQDGESVAADEQIRSWVMGNRNLYVSENVFDFLGRMSQPVDHIAAYRFLEHIAKDSVLGFIYLLSTAVKIGGTVDIIVPNYRKLAEMILCEDVTSSEFDKNDITLTYEMLNEPSMPHASIWTPARAVHFFGYEDRFKINEMWETFEFDGRDIYMRFIAERIK